VKKNRLPIDEAVALIEKADQVLEKVKKPKVKSNKIPRTKKSIQKVQPTQEDLKTYDKSKRNLFDINDQENYKPRKVSIWKKIKSFFGF
jgi:adenylosuccinate synthase